MADTLLATITFRRDRSCSLTAFFLLLLLLPLPVILGVPPVFLVWHQSLHETYDILPGLSSPEHLDSPNC